MNSAILSPCKFYRYRLTRDVPGGVTGRACFVMLNPSTATATIDDPTVARCTGFAIRYGFKQYDIVNLYSYRSHNPDRLLADDVAPQGPGHWTHVCDAISDADVVICAWGAHKAAEPMVPGVLGIICMLGKHPLCFGVNANGSPKHPLYLAADTPLVPYDA